MSTNTEPVKVIFRVDERDGGREVIAVFPELAGDMNPYRTCLCYAHIGQHSSISTDYRTYTRPARHDEYADLLSELQSIGYSLKIVKRASRADLLKRKEQTRR